MVGSNFIWELQSTTDGWGPGRRRLLQRDKDRPVRGALPKADGPNCFSVPVVNS